MPYVREAGHPLNNQLLTPDAAIAAGRCPECGRDLKESSFVVETMLHWPGGLDPNQDQSERIYRTALLAHYYDPTIPAPATPLVLTDEEKLHVIKLREAGAAQPAPKA